MEEIIFESNERLCETEMYVDHGQRKRGRRERKETRETVEKKLENAIYKEMAEIMRKKSVREKKKLQKEGVR